MFNQFTQLFQTSLKPMDKLVELNISTATTVAHQQKLLIASLIGDSLSFSQSMTATTDITHFVAEQSKFSADVQHQLTEAIKETSGTLSKAQKDAGVILNDSLSAFSTKNSKAVVDNQSIVPKKLVKEKPKAAVKATPKAAVKAAPKAAVNAAPKAAVKAAPKATVKAAPKAAVKAAPKAAVKAAPKAAVKAAPKAAVKAAPKAAVKAAPKAEVKVAPKAEVKVAPKAEVKAAPKAEVKAAPKAEVQAAPKK